MQGKIGEIPVPRKPSIEGFGLEDLEPPQPDLSFELRRKAGRAATHPITRQQEEDLMEETPRSPRSSIYTCFAPEDRPIASKDRPKPRKSPARIKHVVSQRRGLDRSSRSSSPAPRQSSPTSPGLHLRHFTGKGDASNLMFTGSSFL
mmetsp:Transcript_65937/g.157491  ORF Transcript_65937/g.157491 Transcript_65937/m.157491 type:complete len:147 (-) Transcript_65937:37-477(-)